MHIAYTTSMQAAMAIPLSFSSYSFITIVSAFLAVLSCSATNAAELYLDTGGLSRKSFPQGFVFGTATSAYQVEGAALEDGRGPCVWDPFVRTSADKIDDRSTADVTTDQYHRYKEDVDMMKILNFDAYRFSISWSRIFPDGTNSTVNWKGVDYYNNLIDYLLERGITPYVNLHHFDVPDALEKKYKGWLSRKIVEDFTTYVDFCFKMFGDRVKNWFTVNEPHIDIIFGYYYGQFPPGRCSGPPYGNCTEGSSMTEPYRAAHNMILAHASAVQKYRKVYKEKQLGRIGIVLDIAWYEPLTENLSDMLAARRGMDFEIGWFLHPIVYGDYPEIMRRNVGPRLPKFTREDKKMVKGSIDLLGINQYSSVYARHPTPLSPLYRASKGGGVDSLDMEEEFYPESEGGVDSLDMEEEFDQFHAEKITTGIAHAPTLLGYVRDKDIETTYEKDGVPIGAHNAKSVWLYDVPWGMYKVLMYIKDMYGNPLVVVTENGMDDAGDILFPLGLHDTARVNYYRGYLDAVKNATKQGANVVGYFAWSLLDNFEWMRGYTARFGIVYVDYKDLKRYPKLSAYWFQKMLQK